VPLLVGVGIVGGTAHLVMTHAYRLAPAAVVAPFDYTGLLWETRAARRVPSPAPGS